MPDRNKDMGHPITEREIQETGVSSAEQLAKLQGVAHGETLSEQEIEDLRKDIQAQRKVLDAQPQVPAKPLEAAKPTLRGRVRTGLRWGLSALTLAGVGGGCATEATSIPTPAIDRPAETPMSTSTPTLVPVETAVPVATSTPVPTETKAPEATPTPEAITFPGITISEEFLVNGLANMGGGGEIPSIEGEEVVKQELSPVEYAQKAWPKEDFSGNFTEDPVKVLEYLAAETSYVGADGETVNFSVYPNLSENGDPLRIKRFKIDELPNSASELKLNPASPDENSPAIKKGTDIIEFGMAKDKEGDSAILAYTDYSAGGVPEHKLAVIPVEKQTGENAPVSLEELENMAGSTLEVKGEDVVVNLKPKDGVQRKWKLNKIASSLFTKIREKIIKQNAPEPAIAQQETLKIEGLKQIWNQEKLAWEYFDPKDNLLVGSWNKEAKKFELDENLTVLRGEWKGLYTSWTPEEAEKALKESLDTENQKARIPIPFKFTEGEIILGKLNDFFGFHKVPVDTTLDAPFAGSIEKRGLGGGPGGNMGVIYLNGSFSLRFVFKDFNDYLGASQAEVSTRLLKFSKEFISKDAILFPNPGDIQIIVVFMPDSNANSFWSINFKNNLLFDDQGKIVHTK